MALHLPPTPVTPVASNLQTFLLPLDNFTGYGDISPGLKSEILGLGLGQLCPSVQVLQRFSFAENTILVMMWHGYWLEN